MRSSPFSHTLVLTGLLALAMGAGAVTWADDIVATFTGRNQGSGDCTVSITSVAFDVENPTSIGSAGGGAGAGKAKLNPIKLTKAVENWGLSLSPNLKDRPVPGNSSSRRWKLPMAPCA